MKRTTLNRFDVNLIKLRHRKGISQEKLAELIKVKRPTIGAWEEGRNEPSLDSLIKLSDVFKVSINTIIRKKLK